MGGIVQFINDILFPVFCVSCEVEGEWLCAKCLGQIPQFANNRCPLCQQASVSGAMCNKCKAVSALDGLTAFFNYKEKNSVIPNLIQLFKYNYAQDIKSVWSKIISTHPVTFFGKSGVVVMPVPLFIRRQRERGFNQAGIIASLLAKQYKTSFDDVSLKRVRATSQQAHLNRLEREKNVEGAFVWSDTKKPPAKVVLVDDVFTTGFTMQACARELKRAGAVEVWSVVLARD